MKTSIRMWVKRSLIGLLVLVVLVGLTIWCLLRASLPQLDGQVSSIGLAASVTVTRDNQGVPTISGTNRFDVAYATGFVHGQDRFFQMDLLRRVAAGELAALVGTAALDIDQAHRFHRFRARAEQALAALPTADRQLLARYTAGVNAGLAGLTVRPFEYGLLNTAPQPWHMSDSLLVVWAMYFDLQGNLESREFARGWIRDHSTAQQLAFLLPESTAWDAPLDAPSISNSPTTMPDTAPDFLINVVGKPFDEAMNDYAAAVGSNNWALSGSRSVHGGAIVANDMHLGIRLPHIWYRALLTFPDAQGKPQSIVGVTLPGAPLVVVGSNGHVAWGFTNSYGDYLDLVELKRDPHQADQVTIANQPETLRTYVEQIDVKGKPPVMLKVQESSLGPIRDVDGRSYAVHWIAHEPGAVNLKLAGLESVADLAAAQQIANEAGLPAQNMVAADAAGHIGWTIAGPLPNRLADHSATFPYADNPQTGWRGLRAPSDYPRVLNPTNGQLWTANNRQLAGDDYRKLGDGGADPAARARQIRDDLSALGKTDEQGAYRIGLDDRAVFVSPWRDRALKVLDTTALADHPDRAAFRRLLAENWSGHASVDSVGYRLARDFEHALYDILFGGLDASLEKLAPDASYRRANPRWASVIARLLDEQPRGWLPKRYADWRAVQLAAIDQVIVAATANGDTLASTTWGRRNTATISHPFSRQLPPPFKDWLSAPADRLAGDENMPRFAGPNFGQSERMVVSPGKEAQGIFNMPGGQSGHPLSPYFLAGHAAWVTGESTPLMPGKAEHSLRFVP